ASVLRRLDALWRGHGGIDRRARQRGSIDGRGRHREYCRWLRRLHRARLDDAVGRREAVAGKDRPADAAALAALVAGGMAGGMGGLPAPAPLAQDAASAGAFLRPARRLARERVSAKRRRRLSDDLRVLLA